jgi:hypothetical protein
MVLPPGRRKYYQPTVSVAPMHRVGSVSLPALNRRGQMDLVERR